MNDMISYRNFPGKVEFDGFLIGLHDPPSDTREFWEGLNQDKLLIKKCSHCGKHLHPRRIVCTKCDSTELGWTEVPGKGEVYTFSVIHRPPFPDPNLTVPYIVGIIRLDEGVHLFANIRSAPEDCRSGLRVKAVFQASSKGKVLNFVPF